jgi:hypothetical protein
VIRVVPGGNMKLRVRYHINAGVLRDDLPG